MRRRWRENQLIFFQNRGKTLRVHGYAIVWNKPQDQGTIEDPRMPLCVSDMFFNGSGEFEVFENEGLVAVAAEDKIHDGLALFHARKPIKDG